MKKGSKGYRSWKKPYYISRDNFSDVKTYKKKKILKTLVKKTVYQQKNQERQDAKNKAIALQNKRIRAENAILQKLYTNQINPAYVENARDGISVSTGHSRLSPRV